MCLIAIAHRASERWPLVIAANRDEFYDRPARAAHWWDDAPEVFGGRDLRAGGSWLAVTRDGRFATVTNVRGFPEPADAPSRGALVGDFVRSREAPLEYARRIATSRYAGFHLVVGEAGGLVAHVSTDTPASVLPDGIFAVSNAPLAVDWPKIAFAREAMQNALSADDLAGTLIRFLTTPRGTPIESEVFVALPERGYGTRASTVVTVDKEGMTTFRERTHPDGREVAATW